VVPFQARLTRFYREKFSVPGDFWTIAIVSFSLCVASGCGRASRAPQRCRNLVQNAAWEKNGAGWLLPPFARFDDATGGIRSLVVEGAADGAIAQMIPKPADLAGLGVIAIGYARVELQHAIDATDDDVTAQLWQGSINLVDGYTTNGRDFSSPYTRVHFTGREAASGEWKRFITHATPAGRARLLYPHFAFWGARLNHGVRLHLAGLSLVEAPADDGGQPETWAECPSLAAPRPVLQSPTQRQWEESQPPDGTLDAFEMAIRSVPGDMAWRELLLNARYEQGHWPADRFLISVTEDGTDPRLSPTSRVITVLAERGADRLQAAVKVKSGARPLRVAVAGAAAVKDGLRAQAALLPPQWQKDHL